MIIGVVHGCTIEQAVQRMQAAAQWVDKFEIRLDRLQGIDIEDDWSPLFARAPRPTIATCRSVREGGGFIGSPDEQRDWLQMAIAAGASMVDIELIDEVEVERDPGQVQLIRSIHQLSGDTPSLTTLLGLAAHAQGLGAEYFKVVFPAKRIDDNLLVREICEASPLPTIAIAAGTLGVPSRIAYRALGSEWTYGSLPDDDAVAPGQVDVRTLRERYRAHEIEPDTKFYGVMGNPVSQSRGVRLHNAAFREMPELDACYLPLHTIEVEPFRRFAEGLPLQGFSVTSPFKRAIVPALDRLDPVAALLGSVNTVVRDGLDRFVGSNTDYAAAFEPWEDRLPGGSAWFAGKRVLVIGAGGVARTMVAGLLARGAEVVVKNRTREKAESLCEEMRQIAHVLSPIVPVGRPVPAQSDVRVSPADAEAPYAGGGPYDAVVNATTVGMAPHAGHMPFDWDVATADGLRLAEGAWAFDLIYNPSPTRWLRDAADLGLQTIGGEPMYRAQASAQFRAWHNAELPHDDRLQEV